MFYPTPLNIYNPNTLHLTPDGIKYVCEKFIQEQKGLIKEALEETFQRIKFKVEDTQIIFFYYNINHLKETFLSDINLKMMIDPTQLKISYFNLPVVFQQVTEEEWEEMDWFN